MSHFFQVLSQRILKPIACHGDARHPPLIHSARSGCYQSWQNTIRVAPQAPGILLDPMNKLLEMHIPMMQLANFSMKIAEEFP